MASRGLLFALSEEEATRLNTAVDQREVVETLEEIEEKWDEKHLQETDKAWDAMHRCLSDGSLNPTGGTYPLNRCVLGGQQLYRAKDQVVSFVPRHEVADVARALEPITKDWMRDRFFALSGYEGPQDEDDFEYTWDYFEGVRCFYKAAAAENRAVVFFVSL